MGELFINEVFFFVNEDDANGDFNVMFFCKGADKVIDFSCYLNTREAPSSDNKGKELFLDFWVGFDQGCL